MQKIAKSDATVYYLCFPVGVLLFWVLHGSIYRYMFGVYRRR